MTREDEKALLARIARLLDSPEHLGHPLYEALEALYLHHRAQQEQLERMITISDRYQQLAMEARQVTQTRYERALRRQQKLSRISDGYQALMRERNQALHEASTHDSLTGLPNRRLIDEWLQRLDGSRCRYTLALLDIDHFKAINDRYGHDVGDRLLVAVSSTMRKALRESDLCGRWGGEEFLLLFTDTALDEAGDIVERLRQQLANVSIRHDNQRLSVTLSAGLSERRDTESHTDTLKRADRALLKAKHDGRDRSLADAKP